MTATAIFTFLLVLAPTTLMGATLPFLVAHLVGISRNVGESVGALYFVNTLGSAAACLLSAVFLMRLLGQQGCVTLAAAINLTIGSAALAAQRLLRPRAADASPNPAPETTPQHRPFPFSAGLILSCACGFLALSYEILWYRAYSFVSGGQASSFALLLAAYLEGIAFGSLLARAACRGPAMTARRTALGTLSTLMAAGSITSFLVVPAAARMVVVLHYKATLPMVALSAGLMGAVFPLISHVSVAADRRAGSRLSYLYLANIIGSAAGAIGVGLFLMEHLSLRGLSTLLLMTGLAIAAALAAIAYRGPLAPAVYAVLALIGAFLSPMLFDSVYERLMYKGDYNPRLKFAHLIESRSGVVSVTREGNVFGGGMYDGQFNTVVSQGTNTLARAYAIAALHPRPRRVLMIGLASGSWAQVVANHPAVEELTIVEINPAYLQLIPLYPNVAGLLHNPKVRIVIDDGRRWLGANPGRRFDLVVMNTTYHWRAHSSDLLSVDFLRRVRPHLQPGGALYYNTTNSGEVQITGATVFPYALRVMGFLAVSDRPLIFDRDAVRRLMPEWRIDGVSPGQADIDAVLSLPLEDAASILLKHRGKRLITDDNMGTEWSQ